jgi:hypothetical protein
MRRVFHRENRRITWQAAPAEAGQDPINRPSIMFFRLFM